jgi:hypothetical protein
MNWAVEVDIIRRTFVLVPAYIISAHSDRGWGANTGHSIPKAALAPQPSRRSPVLRIIYGFASLRSPPGIGDLQSVNLIYVHRDQLERRLTRPAQSSELYWSTVSRIQSFDQLDETVSAG